MQNGIKMLWPFYLVNAILPRILFYLSFFMDVSLAKGEVHLRIFRCNYELLTHMFLCVICVNYADQKKPRK